MIQFFLGIFIGMLYGYWIKEKAIEDKIKFDKECQDEQDILVGRIRDILGK